MFVHRENFAVGHAYGKQVATGRDGSGWVGSGSAAEALGHRDACGAIDFSNVLHIAEAFFAGGFRGSIVKDAV